MSFARESNIVKVCVSMRGTNLLTRVGELTAVCKQVKAVSPTCKIRDGVVGNISACHADARGSIPRRGAFTLLYALTYLQDTLAEWLRRQPAKLLCSARAGSNPAGVDR